MAEDYACLGYRLSNSKDGREESTLRYTSGGRLVILYSYSGLEVLASSKSITILAATLLFLMEEEFLSCLVGDAASQEPSAYAQGNIVLVLEIESLSAISGIDQISPGLAKGRYPWL